MLTGSVRGPNRSIPLAQGRKPVSTVMLGQTDSQQRKERREQRRQGRQGRRCIWIRKVLIKQILNIVTDNSKNSEDSKASVTPISTYLVVP